MGFRAAAAWLLAQSCACATASATQDGILINGLWIDGARWESGQGVLVESEPGTMYAPLPIIHFKPVSGGQALLCLSNPDDA